ncbi:MAG: SRPBCC family protein [Myxococcota bacterium]
MLKWIGIVVLLCLAFILGLAANRPSTIHIARSARIGAPPERVYPLIADLHAFNRWNPWAKMDPEIAIEYRGPRAGEGAVSAWTSDEVGSGSMEITQAREPEWIAIRLDFLEPFAATNEASFTLKGVDGATEVLWEMSGPASFVQRVIGVFVDVDAMMGETFDDGLADLQRIAEAG